MARDEAQFSIIYDGEAVDEGSIDAKELAPALLALAEVIEEAQPLIPELDARISLRVRSDFERGSFEIHLELAKLYQQFRDLFSGQDASAFANLFQILGIAGVVGLAGLFQLIKKPKGRKTSSVTIERSERVKITFEDDDEPVETERRTWQLFQNLRVRKAIEQVIAPLFHKGIDSFEIKHRGRQTLKVSEDEAKYFVAPTEHEGETVTEVDTRAYSGDAGPAFRFMPVHDSGACRAGVKRASDTIGEKPNLVNDSCRAPRVSSARPSSVCASIRL